jgi:hypothetical protein
MIDAADNRCLSRPSVGCDARRRLSLPRRAFGFQSIRNQGPRLAAICAGLLEAEFLAAALTEVLPQARLTERVLILTPHAFEGGARE